MCTIDLKDAYYLVKIDKNSRKFLRFIFKDTLYKFTCLPFGLCTSPFVFTKVMKPVVNTLREQGLMSTIYLDDILCIESTYESCVKNVTVTVTKKLLESLGFLINEEKSMNIPLTQCKFLGLIINSN